MQTYYDPLDLSCKSVVGAVRENVRLKIKVFTDLDEMTLYVVEDESGIEKAYPMTKSEGGFFVSLKLYKGLYWYHFASGNIRIGRGEGMLAEHGSTRDYQLSVCSREYYAPKTLTGGIMYQIFPDRFCRVGDDFEVEEGKEKRLDWGGEPKFRDADGVVRNNEFFGGNFKGITSKLNYLKDLGVTVIYLNPIVKAYSSHRYDTGDYLTPDPVLGTEEDLKELIESADKLGIKLVFDGVYNHTGADSVYFNRYKNYGRSGAYNDRHCKYYKWYSFAWYPDEYAGWWDFKNLPSIRKNSKSYQSFITKEVLTKYFKMGFKGVRLDVVDELEEDFVKKIKHTASSFSKDNVVIGEVWEDATNKIAYGSRRHYFEGDELDSVMNYPLKDAIISFLLKGDTKDIVALFEEQINNYPKEALDNLMNLLSSHDAARVITVLGRDRVVTDKDLLKYEKLSKEGYERGKKLAKLAYTVIFTCYGVPCIYYGDEVGLDGDLDPYNRRCFPWGREDKDMLEYIKTLTKIRSSSAAIKTGDLKIVSRDRRVLVYTRTLGNETVLVAISRDDETVKLKLNVPMAEFGKRQYLSEYRLPPFGALILRTKKQR